jgi:lipopolysaccharide assembly outer membrane protein LptD (OstA)
LSVYGRYERNLEEDQDLLKQIGLVFTFQCWALDLNYIEEEQDRSFGFRISLSGLGEIGQRFSPRSITSPFSN